MGDKWSVLLNFSATESEADEVLMAALEKANQLGLEVVGGVSPDERRGEGEDDVKENDA